MATALIQADSLRLALESDIRPQLFDCRFRLGEPHAGRQLWRKAHIPGSQHLDLDQQLADTRRSGGRHPLPDEDSFRCTLQQLGVHPERPIMVFDDMGGQLAAARAWWMLSQWAGHPNVMLLDGGLAAWQAIGGAWQTGEGMAPDPSDWQPQFSSTGLITMAEVAASEALKVDARAGERFRGEQEPMDPRAGHIPGAVNRPCAENLDGEGRFKSAARLDRELPRAEEVIAYCGSGVTACHNILAYQIAGRPLPRLYVGSWSEWSGDPARPAETGNSRA